MSRTQRIVGCVLVLVGLWLFERWSALAWRLKNR
jgi:hypothetical protein